MSLNYGNAFFKKFPVFRRNPGIILIEGYFVVKIFLKLISILQQGGNPCNQQFTVERFYYIIIGTTFYSLEPELVCGSTGKQDNRDMAQLSIFFNFFTQLNSTHFLHVNIGDNQVRQILLS